MEFVGQKKTFEILNRFTVQSLPHTLLFLGDDGCGKKTLARYLSNKLGFKLIEINSSTAPDELIDYRQTAVKTFYLIDLTKCVLEKEQNKFLKFIEEPTENTYIILIGNSDAGILPTILNRCTKLRFEPYTEEQLSQVKHFSNPIAYRLCTTPGQLNLLDDSKLSDLEALCTEIATKSHLASYPGIISVVPRINYKEEYTKFEFNTFFRMLELVARQAYIEANNQTALKVYLYTVQKRQLLTRNANIAKETFVTNFMDGLWREFH